MRLKEWCEWDDDERDEIKEREDEEGGLSGG